MFRFYGYFAAAYGTCWLLLFFLALATWRNINLGAFGFFGFPALGIIYAGVRMILPRDGTFAGPLLREAAPPSQKFGATVGALVIAVLLGLFCVLGTVHRLPWFAVPCGIVSAILFIAVGIYGVFNDHPANDTPQIASSPVAADTLRFAAMPGMDYVHGAPPGIFATPPIRERPCQYCGSPVLPQHKYCPNCGRPSPPNPPRGDSGGVDV